MVAKLGCSMITALKQNIMQTSIFFKMTKKLDHHHPIMVEVKNMVDGKLYSGDGILNFGHQDKNDNCYVIALSGRLEAVEKMFLTDLYFLIKLSMPIGLVIVVVKLVPTF